MIDNILFDETDSARNVLRKLEKTLDHYDYKRNEAKTEKCNYYFLNSQLSKSYEIRADYYNTTKDDRPVALTIRERALNWVSFTVLGNGNVPDGCFCLVRYYFHIFLLCLTIHCYLN